MTTARHAANRAACVADMATWLLRSATHELGPGATHAEVVAAALDTTRRLAPEAWAELGRRAGHYAGGATPDPVTCDAVVRQLSAMTVDPGDVFAGIPAA